MSERIVNALAQMKQVYLESVAHNNLEQQKIDEEVRQMNEYRTKLDPVGEEDSDVNNDGEVDDTDDYLLNRRKVRTNNIESEKLAKEIIKAIKGWKGENGTHNSNESAANVEKIMHSIQGLRPPVAESSFYSWRDTIGESVLWEITDDNQVTKKKVNNYVGKPPVVELNPEMKTESVLIDSEELDEDFIEESIDIATEILLDEGLDVDGIYDLIEELGSQEFYEWVLSVGYENLELIERRLRPGETALPAKTREIITGKPVSRRTDLKGAAASAKERGDVARREARAAARETPEPTERQKRLASLLAKQKTKTSTPAKPASPAKPGLFSTAMERDRAARQKAGELVRQTVQTAQKAGQVASRFGSEMRSPFESKGGRNLQAALIRGLRTGSRAARDAVAREVARRRVMGEDFELWVEDLLEEGYDLSEYTWDELYEEFEILQEKAVSEQQQKLFGLALAVKRGETPRSEVSDEVLKIVDYMSEKEIRKYAKTSHSDIPKRADLAEKVIHFVRENR